MNLRSLVQRYRTYDPVTGEFNAERSLREYARLLNVDHSGLWRYLDGEVADSKVVLNAFLRTFPWAASEVTQAMLAEVA